MNITTPHTPTQLAHVKFDNVNIGYDPKFDVCSEGAVGSANQCSTAATVDTRRDGVLKTNPGCSTAANDLREGHGHAWCYCDKFDEVKDQHRWRFCSPDEVAEKNNTTTCECSISALTCGDKTNPACSSLKEDLYNGHPWCFCERKTGDEKNPKWKYCNEAEINKAVAYAALDV